MSQFPLPSRRRRDSRIQERFDRFHVEHPDVFILFRRFATEKREAGHKHYSADAILHRVRWETDSGATKGGPKINDHFSSRYARLLMYSDKAFKGFFRTRALRS